MRKLMFILMLILSLSGCDKDFSNDEIKLVVDGYIDDGGNPVIFVTTTLPVRDGATGMKDIKDHLAIFGKITITVDGVTRVMTATPKSTLLPPYEYTHYSLTGEAGKTYTIDVTYYDLHATATTTIPQKTELDEIWTEQITDSLYTIKTRFTDREGKGDHYKFFSYCEGETYTNYGSCMLGLIDDADLNDSVVEATVYRPVTMDTRSYSPYFKKGETVYIKFCTLDEDSYEFWKDFETQRLGSRIALFPSSNNIHHNVEGGLGLWAGYGASFYTVHIPE